MCVMAVMGMMMRNPKRKRNASNNTARRNNKIRRKPLQTSHSYTFFPQIITRIVQHPVRLSKGTVLLLLKQNEAKGSKRDGGFCFIQRSSGDVEHGAKGTGVFASSSGAKGTGVSASSSVAAGAKGMRAQWRRGPVLHFPLHLSK